MANPRVFISSTCYDLTEVRDGLIEFIRSYGFDPVASDRGDIFYHPDAHTHESCIAEVGNCQLLILIIGGRFGGSYQTDKTKSIVNAEYSCARELKIPVFTFVKNKVFSDQHVYKENKKINPSLDNIYFPSIDNQKHASSIFEFIDDVKRSPVNNGMFTFEFGRDITNILRKQWAGMFFDFLYQRKLNEEFRITTNLLTNISQAGQKIEDLIKLLYRHVDQSGDAETDIAIVEKRSIATRFFVELREMISKRSRFDLLVKPVNFHYWHEYIAKATSGEIISESGVELIAWKMGNVIVNVSNDATNLPFPLQEQIKTKFNEQQNRFEIVKKLDYNIVETIISENFVCTKNPNLN